MIGVVLTTWILTGVARAAITQDEAQAIADLLTIVESETSYAAANCGYYSDLPNLCHAYLGGNCRGVGIPGYPASSPTFISPDLGRVSSFVKSGFIFRWEGLYPPPLLSADCDNESVGDYCIEALPELFSAGARSFAATSDGVIRYDAISAASLACPVSSSFPVLGLPTMTVPAPGSVLSGASVSAQWSQRDVPVTEWRLYVGSTPGANNYFDSGSLGTSTTTVVSGLPTDGATIHVRLWFRLAGAWKFTDSQYRAANLGAVPPALIAPAPGAPVSGPSATFQWQANGTAVAEWLLYVGASRGGNDYFDSGPLRLQTSVGVTNLPVDGSTLYVRLWYRNGGPWSFVDSTNSTTVVASGTPDLTAPVPGSTYSASTVSFQWTANGASVSQWWLYAGSSLGARDYFDSSALGSTSVSATGLPVDGSTVSVRLWYRVAGAWLYRDYEFQAPALSSMMTGPVPGSRLTGSSASFLWNPNGQPVTEWWLYVGSVPGGKQYFDSGSLGTSLSVTATSLPTSGGKLYVRLWYRLSGVWKYSDFVYLAAGS